jgi:hypothetical protein
MTKTLAFKLQVWVLERKAQWMTVQLRPEAQAKPCESIEEVQRVPTSHDGG